MKNVLKKIYSSVHKFLQNISGFITYRIKLFTEKLKYKDKRRVAIYSKMILTKEQKKAIDSLFKNNYGSKIPYTWHRHFTMFTGNFDANYFPELLYIPLFERVMNQYQVYAKVFSDKNLFLKISNGLGVKTPKTIISITKGAICNSDNILISNEKVFEILKDVGKVFIKPTANSNSGRGCFIAEFVNGIDINSGKTVEDVFNSLGEDTAIQECIECHASISALHENSVNTFRIITYRWKNEIVAMPVIMRIGQGGKTVDNAHAGGMFIALDNDGTMHKTAFTEFNTQYTVHPTSGVTFEGYKIDLLPKVIETAKKMHMGVPQLGTINWDFTIDKFGEAILIEANTLAGSVWLIQMAHGRGAFGERTEEVLQWLKVVKKKPSSKLKYYAFGNIPNKK